MINKKGVEMKKIMILLILVILMIVISTQRYKEAVTLNIWGHKFYNDYSLLYEKRNNSGFHYDGYTYRVYHMEDFSDQTSIQLEPLTEALHKDINDVIEILNVNTSFIANENSVMGYHEMNRDDELIILYDPYQDYLYVIEINM